MSQATLPELRERRASAYMSFIETDPRDLERRRSRWHRYELAAARYRKQWIKQEREARRKKV